MSGWEYKVVPAPVKGVKAPGIKGPEGRFANALEVLMNDMGGDGWEYQRAETLPSVERSGLTSTTTEWRNVLVFRRRLSAPIEDFEPELLPAPEPVEIMEQTPEPAFEEAPEIAHQTDIAEPPDAPAEDAEDAFTPGNGARLMLPDNGVEETSEVMGMTASLKNLASQRNKKESER